MRLLLAVLTMGVLMGLAPIPVFAGVLVFDDFNDGDAAGWEEFDGTFSVVDGVYRVGASGGCNDARAVIGDPAWSDYIIETDFNFTEGSDHAAILFRVQEIVSGCDAGKYYQFHIFQNNVGICRMNYSGGSCSILKSVSTSVSANQWHHLVLIVNGPNLTAFIDGFEILTFDGLTHYPAGRVGVKNINNGANLYDNFEVYTGLVSDMPRAWGAVKAMYR